MRLHAIIHARYAPAVGGAPGVGASTLEQVHARIQGRIRGHG